MTEGEKVDPEVSAGELRARGFPVPASVPDCARIPRSSIEVGVSGVEVGKDGVAKVAAYVRYSVPFEWIELTVTLPEGA